MVAALMGFTVASAQTNVVDSYNQSVQALQGKDYAKAIELLEAVIADGDGEEDEAIMGCVENAKKNLPVAYQGMGLRAAAAAMKAQKPEDKDAKFAEALSFLDKAKAKAKATMSQYTNNKIAAMQQANDFDGIIKMSETIADKALAQKVAVQAYFLKKDYAKVIEIGEAAAALQTDEESKSAVYFNLGSAYNAKEMRDKAIEALKKVTAEPYATPAKEAAAALAQ